MTQEKKTFLLLSIFILVSCAAVLVLLDWRSHRAPGDNAHVVHVVAGENFWGSIVAQIGGEHVAVDTMVSDPNADPHEFATTATTARAFAQANYVILNGAGYDSWGDHLLASQANTQRTVMHVADIVGKKAGDNPHIWYDPSYVNLAAARMAHDLSSLDPANARYYQAQYTKLKASFTVYQDRIAVIKKQYSGVKVAATEDIFQYFADASGLDLVSPLAFTQAVAEGNDPPASSVVAFQEQLTDGGVKVLIYNAQTATPLTDSMKQLAMQHHIPIVGISETISPAHTSFQDWMNTEAIHIQTALKG